MYVLSTPFARTTPNTLQLRCLMKRVWAKLSNTIHCTYGQLFVQLRIQLPFRQRQLPLAEVPSELKINENSKPKICLLFGCKNDGNAVARSILLVSEIVRKQGPLKIKN